MNAKCKKCGALFLSSPDNNVSEDTETCTAEGLKDRLNRHADRFLIFSVGFDGTCVTNDYPYVGHDIGAAETLRTLTAKGHRIVLSTTRTGKELEDAIRWFNGNGISLFDINGSPGLAKRTTGRKTFADIYIDCLALGCPLYEVSSRDGRIHRFTNWKRVAKWLLIEGIFDIDDYMRCVAETSGVYGKIERLINGEENESQS